MSTNPAAVPSPSPNKRPLKFVASDGDGLPLKRRQAQQACAACRRKKKRCPHSGDGTGGNSNNHHARPELASSDGGGGGYGQQPRAPTSPVRPAVGSQTAATVKRRTSPHVHRPEQTSSPADQNEASSASAEIVASHLVELSASRFVGDLDPESIFIEAAQKRSEQSSLHRNHSEVGMWMRQAAEAPPPAEPVDAPGRTAVPGRRPSHTQQPSMADAVPVPVPGLRIQPTQPPDDSASLGPQLTVCPPEPDFQHLHTIYSQQIQPMLPFLEATDLDAITRNLQTPSPRHRVLQQVVALAAAVDSSATKHLRLDAGGPLLSFQSFHQRLAKAVFLSLDANVLTDRIDRIRVLLVLNFFYQPSNPLERDVAPLIFSQAVHFVQSLGVHLRGYRSTKRLPEDGAVERLFCLCWALDRINAAFHGRPCLLHERDTDRDLDECIAAQPEPAFRLFMTVAKLLDSIIWLYRPRNENAAPVELPIFESMIISVGGERLHPRMLTTIEVFYHAVSVLSCRQPLSDFQPTAPPLAHLPEPHLNARRSLSADRIIEIVESCLPSADGLCTLPFVPYAVALALSVAYRKMRYSRIPMYRIRGKDRFKEVVGLLQMLGEVYTSARVNASLGVSILRELDKTVKEFASSSMPTPGGGDTAAATPQTTTQAVASSFTTAHPAASFADKQKASLAIAAGRSSDPLAGAHARSTPATAAAAAAINAAAAQAHQQASRYATPGEGHASTFHQLNTSSGELSNDTIPSQQPRSVPLNPTVSSSTSATASWSQVEDIDLFGYFDPSYDLNAVEAALEANLDMGFPQTWTMPWMG